jgi:hypothetical protein
MRGLAQTEYAPGGLRERLFRGRGARLGSSHPAARYRGLFKTADASAAMRDSRDLAAAGS